MSITLTERAAKEVQNYKNSVQAPVEDFLRVRLMAGGCSGHSPKLDLDSKFDEKADSRYTFHGVDLVVDKKSELYLEDATIDFVEGFDQSGFKVDIPMAKKSCGCGSSYQF
ncbi:Iron-sulfur cluster insertion protein ErpA [Anatilimnocola aggregata]|uniref:Iron-sulfur cluster insertion protein ErpA n=1 Tax=Anatilimnocola aggregata TaxID=2528021 RepID=A0A517YEI0_9BACT|nr:iron-sulfur cluster assembly accessory protein [Anatilimnocola aggregata]QDU28645.1 Iron-sulfur cluster insertion protein ErpA [Anatilimnocola aggregata]